MVQILETFPTKVKYLSTLHRQKAADGLVIQGAKASAAMVLA